MFGAQYGSTRSGRQDCRCELAGEVVVDECGVAVGVVLPALTECAGGVLGCAELLGDCTAR